MIVPTHARIENLDLLMTDVPDLVWVAVVAPLGSSDHGGMITVGLIRKQVLSMTSSRGTAHKKLK